MVRAAPDGYPVGIGHWSMHVVNGAIYDLPYDLLHDLEPVARLPSNPQFIVSKKNVPARDLKEFIAWIKTDESRITAGTAGAGSAAHVAGVHFQTITGTHFPFVPYRGTGPALNDLIAGQIDLMVDQTSNSMAQVKAGAIKAYALTAKERLASAPDIPSVDEAGVPGLTISRSGTDCGYPRVRRRRSSPGSTRPPSRRWRIPPSRTAWMHSASKFRRPSKERASARWIADGGRSSRPRTSPGNSPT